MTKWIDQTTWRFLLVGCINTLFGTSIMFLAYNVLGLSYWLSSASNYFFGSILSYFLNKYFTFQKKDKSIGDILPFALNITICYFITYGLSKPLVANLFSSLSVSMKDNGPCWWVCAYLLASTILVNDTLFSKKKSDESLLLTNLAMAIDFIFS